MVRSYRQCRHRSRLKLSGTFQAFSTLDGEKFQRLPESFIMEIGSKTVIGPKNKQNRKVIIMSLCGFLFFFSVKSWPFSGLRSLTVGCSAFKGNMLKPMHNKTRFLSVWCFFYLFLFYFFDKPFREGANKEKYVKARTQRISKQLQSVREKIIQIVVHRHDLITYPA